MYLFLDKVNYNFNLILNFNHFQAFLFIESINVLK
jgi:hypothetical protein